MWLVFVEIFVFFLAAALVYYYARRGTRWYVYITVYYAWFLAFSIVFLVPADVGSTRCQEDNHKNDSPCDQPDLEFELSTLPIIWRLFYWSTFFLCWSIIPMQQSYVEAGEFTRPGKIKRAVIENAIFYGSIGLIGVLFLIYLAIKNSMGFAAIKNFCMAAANAWALTLLIILLGYGLVEVPKSVWNSGNHLAKLRKCEYMICQLYEDLDETTLELNDVSYLVREAHNRAQGDPELSKYTKVMVDLLQPAPPATTRRRVSLDSSVADMMKYSKLCSLHRRLKRAITAQQRAEFQWNYLLNRAFYLQDIAETREHPQEGVKAVVSPLKPLRSGRLGKLYDYLEWMWKVYLELWVMRLVALGLGGTSVLIVISEVTLFLNWTVFSAIASQLSVGLLQLFVIILICYMALCTYFSLFRMKLFSLYALHGNRQTDQYSILFNATYLCRLGAPLSYNFLLLVGQNNTAFSKFMGEMLNVPVLGEQFVFFYPVVLLVLTIGTLFNLYSKCCNVVGVQKFQFDSTYEDDQVQEGREILRRMREKQERDAPKVNAHDKIPGGGWSGNGRKIDYGEDPGGSPILSTVEAGRDSPQRFWSGNRSPESSKQRHNPVSSHYADMMSKSRTTPFKGRSDNINDEASVLPTPLLSGRSDGYEGQHSRFTSFDNGGNDGVQLGGYSTRFS